MQAFSSNDRNDSAEVETSADKTVTIMAPIIINGTRGNMGAVVRFDENNKYYKVHRIIMPDGSVFVYDNKKKE